MLAIVTMITVLLMTGVLSRFTVVDVWYRITHTLVVFKSKCTHPESTYVRLIHSMNAAHTRTFILTRTDAPV